MQQFSALSVFWAGSLIENAKSDCLLSSAITGGDTPLFNLMMPIDERAKAKSLELLNALESDCKKLELRIAGATLAELRTDLAGQTSRHNLQWLMDQLKALRDLMVKEMKGRLYVYIPPESAKYFSSAVEPELFGKAVALAFPSAHYDISESGACLATMRPTAAVFHLMRVLECGLAALGAVFAVSLAHTNWAPALDQIESRIRDMHKDPIWKGLPNCKDLQVKYAQVASTFGVLKDAWRNHTMHGRNIYELAEAEHIFSNVKSFMQKLEALGLKE